MTTTTTTTTTLHSSNYQLFKLSVSLVTSSALHSTSSSRVVVFVVFTIDTNQHSKHGKSFIDFCSSIIATHIDGKNERQTLFAAYGCDDGHNDDQINRISVTLFIMNNVINHIVNPVCCSSCCSHGCRSNERLLLLLLLLVIRRKENHGLNVSSGCGVQFYANQIHRDKQSSMALRNFRVHHHYGHCDDICVECNSIGPWRRRSVQSFKIISFKQQSIRNWCTCDDTNAVDRLRKIAQLICDLCENILTRKLDESVASNDSEELSGNFDLNLNSNLLFRLAAATAAAAAGDDNDGKLLVYSIICTKHCRRRRGRRRPYRPKCVPSPANGWQLQQMVQCCCHAHANSCRRCRCSDSVPNNHPYDVFTFPFHNNNNNSIYCQQSYMNGLLSLAKPSVNNNGCDGDAVSLPRSIMTDCNDPYGYLHMMKSLEWMNIVKLHSNGKCPTVVNAIAMVETSPSPSIPNEPLSSITILPISSEKAHEIATQATPTNATISTTNAVSATGTTTPSPPTMALDQCNANAPTKTLAVLVANQRISRINSSHRTSNAGCCPTPTSNSAVTSRSNTYLKRHLYLLLMAFLTCCAPFASAASMHNMKYSTNVVKTKYGQLRGIVVRSNPTVEAYLGVPYATPPVGSLR